MVTASATEELRSAMAAGPRSAMRCALVTSCGSALSPAACPIFSFTSCHRTQSPCFTSASRCCCLSRFTSRDVACSLVRAVMSNHETSADPITRCPVRVGLAGSHPPDEAEIQNQKHPDVKRCDDGTDEDCGTYTTNMDENLELDKS